MKRVLWLTLVMTALSAQSARASIWDIIWEMSGPQMIGFAAQCDVRIRPSGHPLCDVPFRVDLNWQKHLGQRRIWIALEPGFFFASGRNPDDEGNPEFRFARAKMVALDGSLMVSWRLFGLRGYSGVGASFNHFFGTEVQHMNKGAVKVRPFVVPLGDRFDLAYTFRYYPDGFNVIARPTGGKLVSSNRSEYVHGVAVIFSR